MESIIDRILTHNNTFVDADKAAPYRADKKPAEKLAVVACMDTRLITMLTAALGLKNGEANVITVAGAEVSEPYGAVMRSLLVAIYELGVEDVMIVAHTNCGAQHMSGPEMKSLMVQANISEKAFETVSRDGIELDSWLAGFGDTEAAVKRSVAMVSSHPLVAAHVRVHGFVIETDTGKLHPVV